MTRHRQIQVDQEFVRGLRTFLEPGAASATSIKPQGVDLSGFSSKALALLMQGQASEGDSCSPPNMDQHATLTINGVYTYDFTELCLEETKRGMNIESEEGSDKEEEDEDALLHETRQMPSGGG